MITDVTGIELIPGNHGNDCFGNGEHYNKNGVLSECCCDECDYMLCCFEDRYPNKCKDRTEYDCPRKNEIQSDVTK